jgi:hypothetical protein
MRYRWCLCIYPALNCTTLCAWYSIQSYVIPSYNTFPLTHARARIHYIQVSREWKNVASMDRLWLARCEQLWLILQANRQLWYAIFI